MKEELMQKVVTKALDQLENSNLSLFGLSGGLIVKYSDVYHTNIDFFVNKYEHSDSIKLDVEGVDIDITDHRDKLDSFLERVEINKLKKYLNKK